MASSLTEAQKELASSLKPDDIPIKLRCAICSKLAVNALRLPCCEQAICETCHSALPSSCPVCEHSPLSAADCNPHNKLRTTIKVFLRNAEKKRDAGRPKDANEAGPETPMDTKPTAPVDLGVQSEIKNATSLPTAQNDPLLEERESASAVDIRQSRDNSANEDAPQIPEKTDEENRQAIEKQEAQVSTDAVLQTEERNDDDSQKAADQQPNEYGQDYGFDPSGGAYPNMDFSGPGDYTQMQMMMAMQNGMQPNSFGSFPMMGMPGMNMDPMVMQNMYMNGGFGQGMGMNGMNSLSMNLGGFGGGMGPNDNWNEQQSWNFGQDNFNHATGSGMGPGDYGNYNTGYQSGFNQGNFGHQYNDRRGHYGYRGRGRGRGFYDNYGRGRFHNQGNAGRWQAYGSANYAQGPSTIEAGEPEYGNADESGRQGGQAEDEVTKDDGAGVSTETDRKDGNSINDNKDAGAAGAEQGGAGEVSRGAGEAPADGGDALPTETNDGHPSPQRHDHQPPSKPGYVPQVAPPDVPINAPKGPKAMRQGLPNTSLPNLRARGYNVYGDRAQRLQSNGADHQSRPIEVPRVKSPSPHSHRDLDQHQDHSGDRGRDVDRRDRDYDDNPRDYSRSRSRSRSPSRDRRSSRRHRRSRSESEYSDDREERRGSRKHRSRKHTSYDDDDDDGKSRSRDDKYERSRSTSPHERKRSSRRRRERDPDKRRDRDSAKHYDDEQDRKRSGHRSRRDRERETHREKESSRTKDSTRDRRREERHRSSKHSTSEPQTPTERQPPEKEFNPPAGPRASLAKNSGDGRTQQYGRGAAEGRRASQASVGSNTMSAPVSAPAKNPHTLEREARDRERLLKEAQRIAGLASLTGVKRPRDDGGDDGRRGRRKGRRSEVVLGDDGEERMRRLEAEREGGRWG